MPITLDPIDIIVDVRPNRQQLLAPLLQQIKQQTEEMLPFDEPRTENGEQLDGSLRPAWESAYRRGRYWYEFNGDKYVTMRNGRPFVPQVCSDFIVDSIDRTAGSWYVASVKRPGRTVGVFDLRGSVKDADLDPRRLNELISFFKQRPNDFSFVFEGRGPKTSETKKLKKWMKELNVDVGDIIIFRGRVPWDNGKEEHNHSMFVTRLDDKGQVELVTGNPVWPIERTLRIEGNRTPKRRVTHIIRMTDEFLTKLR